MIRLQLHLVNRKLTVATSKILFFSLTRIDDIQEKRNEAKKKNEQIYSYH